MELTDIEILCLDTLTEKQISLEDLAHDLNENMDSVRRAVNLLKEKGLVKLDKKEVKSYKLSKFGKMYLKEPFPEELILNILTDDMPLTDFRKKLGSKSAFIFGYAMKNKLIQIKDNVVFKTDKLKDFGFNVFHDALNDLEQGKTIDKNILDELLKQNLIETVSKSKYFVSKTELGEKSSNQKIEKTVTDLTQDMLKNKTYKNVNFKSYNVVAPTDNLNIGKYQPYMRFLDLIKRKMNSLGFEEMPSNLITKEFYNFDVLFQPQNHPARTWTDTYSLKKPSKGKLPDRDLVTKIKNAHENGGNTESKGWNYSWQEDIAKKLMPSAHGTAWSAMKMTLLKDTPKRYFAVARCYRPDVVDATHLSEFNQLEGFVVGDDISFKNLLGLLSQFARDIAGAEETRFFPDYYPFTEPSVALHAKHPKLGWVELGGAGIFRPEITETLGIKGRVIAWGLGIDRLAMFNLKIKDIRELFSTKLDWLRDKPIIDKI